MITITELFWFLLSAGVGSFIFALGVWCAAVRRIERERPYREYQAWRTQRQSDLEEAFGQLPSDK